MKVVAIGGGHGLAVTLQAAATYAASLTAVVTGADDGGSSGKLREATGLPAMGDIRRCLSALAEPRSLGEMFEHRFGDDLAGHALGNLVIAALAQRLGFGAAIDELGRLLHVPARVLPATEEPVELVGRTATGAVVRGQVAVQHSREVIAVELDPVAPSPYAEAVAAIGAADQIVIGPGSLFTSVLAALAVPGIRDAVAAARGRPVYVCNLQPQVPETAGFDAAAHVDALHRHGVAPDVVLADPELADGALQDHLADAVAAGARVLVLADEHSPEQLTAILESGASGYLLADCSPEDLIQALLTVAGGDVLLDPKVAATILTQWRRLRAAEVGVGTGRLALTPRERELLAEMAEGRSTKAIARSLGISVKTVENHKIRIFDKLGVRTHAQAVSVAISHGLAVAVEGGRA